jgi:protein CWC15
MSRHVPIPTQTKRGIDVPSHTKLLYREPASVPASREELKRKLEENEKPEYKKTHEDEGLVSAPLPLANEDDEEGSSHYSSESDESEEDEEELMRELARIKQERAEAARLAKEKEIATANPLLNAGGSASLQRRWDDDTVFKGQASKPSDKKPASFVNDAVRTQFHKKFLNKYVV